MGRRLSTLLLVVAVILAAVAGSPCTGRAFCLRARTADCCSSKPGIGTPRCCEGPQRLTRAASPATVERPAASLYAPSAPGASVAVARVASTSAVSARRPERTHAPPGDTLIAQHTSLL